MSSNVMGGLLGSLAACCANKISSPMLVTSCLPLLGLLELPPGVHMLQLCQGLESTGSRKHLPQMSSRQCETDIQKAKWPRQQVTRCLHREALVHSPARAA